MAQSSNHARRVGAVLLAACLLAAALLAGLTTDAGAARPGAATKSIKRAPLARSCSLAAMSSRARRVRVLRRRAKAADSAAAERRLRTKVRRAKSMQRNCRAYRRNAARGGDCDEPASISSFRVGAPACWRPYADDSPWNRKVPAGARLHARSSPIVSRMLSWGDAQRMRAGHADTGGDYDHPIYFAKPSDPVYTLRATRDWGEAEIEGHQIHIPAAAKPAAGGDGHMAVIQPDGWEYDLWTVQSKGRAGGVVRFGWGGRTRIDGDGLGSNATAAHFGLAAGVIRAPELEAGRIDHALFMGVKCTDAKGTAVYPAAEGTGEPCSDLGMSNKDAPPLGSRFVLDMSDAQIEALAVPRWKKTILHALADYGMITGDRFGSGAWGLQMESGSTYTSFGEPDRPGLVAKAAGADEWDGSYLFDLQDGVDWKKHLRLVDPCVSQGTC